MSMNVVTLLYLVASVCFIQALKGLSHPTTSIRGNIFGMVGMTIAVFTTAALIYEVSGGSLVGLSYVLVALVIGAPRFLSDWISVPIHRSPRHTALARIVAVGATTTPAPPTSQPTAAGTTTSPRTV